MTIQKPNEAHGLTLRFRHLAGELRDARRGENRGHEISEITKHLFVDLVYAWGENLLPAVINEAVLHPESGGCDAIIGYEKKTSEAFPAKEEPSVLDNQFDESFEYLKENGVPEDVIKAAVDSAEWEGVVKHVLVKHGGTSFWLHLTDLSRESAVYISPGFISMVWPEVFQPIIHKLSGPVSDSEDAINQAIEAERFRITGYVALAYEKLADWIEAHADDERDDRIAPGDGLKCDDTIFVWGGKTYIGITATIAPLLKVLMKAFRECRDGTLIEFENALGVKIEDGFGRCFDVGKHPNRSKHPVWEIIAGGRGKYRLIDPVKPK